MAFLALDETLVDEYSFPIYNPTENSSAVIPYTEDVVMKYPKPGYNNPLVSVHVFDLEQYEDASAAGFSVAGATFELDWLERHPKEESIISEVTWVGNSTLIVKEVNRAADNGNVVLFNIDIQDEVRRRMGRIVRKQGKNGEEGDDGWIESVNTFPIPIAAATDYFIITSLNLFTPSRRRYRLTGASCLHIWTSSQLRRDIIISPCLRKLHLTHLISSPPGSGKLRAAYMLWIRSRDLCEFLNFLLMYITSLP